MNTKVIIIAGWPGVGKTTLAKQLQKDTGYVILNKDDLTKDVTSRLHEILGIAPEDRESILHTTVVRSLTHQMLYNAAHCVLDSGHSVIIDTPFDQYITKKEWYSHMAEEIGCCPLILWIEIPKEQEYQQLLSRNRAIDSWKITHFDEYYARRQGMNYEVPSEYFVRCSNSYEELVKYIKTYQKLKGDKG